MRLSMFCCTRVWLSMCVLHTRVAVCVRLHTREAVHVRLHTHEAVHVLLHTRVAVRVVHTCGCLCAIAHACELSMCGCTRVWLYVSICTSM